MSNLESLGPVFFCATLHAFFQGISTEITHKAIHILSDANLLAPTGKVNPYFFLPPPFFFVFLLTITHTTLAVNPTTSGSCWLAEGRGAINQKKIHCFFGARTP